jgi:4-oxalocrotonate tautomerase
MTEGANDAISEFREEADMPLIQVKLIEGVFTEGQKRAIVQKLTDAMVAIEGESMRPVTWVLLGEIKSGDWGMGGKAVTAADVKALAGKPTG